LIEQNEGGRSVERHLSSELTADGSSRTSDQNRLAMQVGRKLGEFQLDWLPPKQALDSDPAQVVQPNVPRQYFANTWQHLERQPCCLALLHDPPQIVGSCRRYSDNNFLRPRGGSYGGKVARGADDLNAMEC